MNNLTDSNLDKAIAPEGAKGTNIRDYGAIPNDGIDDTAAIQKALDDQRRDANGKTLHSDFYGRPKHLYLPKGTYDISDTIDWVGNAVTLNGDGSGQTILKLENNATGFDDTTKPKAVIETSDGNMAFRNNIWNLSVDIGKNNAGAVGIDYGASNNGSMENVTVTSGDGQGHIGVSMTDGIPGPLLIKDVKVDGFDTGIRNSGPYSATFKDIELTNQNQAGFNAGGGTLVIHGLKSNNSVPAIKSDYWFDMVTIVDGEFKGGDSNTSAIEAEGRLYARDITTKGYQSAIKYQDDVLSGSTVEEFASDTTQLFDNSAQKSLNLPIKDFPEFNDKNLDNWGRFEPRWYGDTDELQALFDSGKSTIYFPARRYFSYNQRTIVVPPTVKKIVGFSSVVNGDWKGENGGGIRFVAEGDSKSPLIIEGFGYGVTVENQAARDVAIKNGKYKYIDGPGASDLYIENVEIGRLELKDTENVYAWQLNTESLDKTRTKVTNSGANMVIFGIKTEGKGPVIETVDGGKTEVLGGVILPIQSFSKEESKQPAFSIVDSKNADSEGSFNLRFRHYESPDRMYDILVEETQAGETRQLKQSTSPHQFLTLYSGNQTVGDQTVSSGDSIPAPIEPSVSPAPAPKPDPSPLPDLTLKPSPAPTPSPSLPVANPGPGLNPEPVANPTPTFTDPVSSQVNITLSADFVRGRPIGAGELLVTTTDDKGQINGIAPGEKGYTDALLEQASVVFSTLKMRRLRKTGTDRSLSFDKGSKLQFSVLEGGTLDKVRQGGDSQVRLAYLSGDRRPISVDTLQATNSQLDLRMAPASNGSTKGVSRIGLQTTHAIASSNRTLQSRANVPELLDFRGETGSKTLKFEVSRNGGYDSSIGFYAVENEQGQVFDEFDTLLNPGADGYVKAAMRNRLANIELRGEKGKVNQFTAEVEMNQLLASFIVIDSGIEPLLDNSPSNDPNIFFTHLGANTDETDHVRSIGNNILGFEDLPGGGDFDYNDITVKTTVV